MTEQLLKDIIKDAKEKKQTGLFIWAGWTTWDNVGYTVKPGQENYDFALSQIFKNEEATIYTNWNGLTMPGFIAVSIEKLDSSLELFNKILEISENCYKGPVTLVPLNKLSKCS